MRYIPVLMLRDSEACPCTLSVSCSADALGDQPQPRDAPIIRSEPQDHTYPGELYHRWL